MKAITITCDMLRVGGIPQDQLYAFEELFPNGFRVTMANCRRLQHKFWAPQLVYILKALDSKRYAKYDKYLASEMRRHDRYCRPSWRAYEHNEAKAFIDAMKRR
jgi:hypothetical protein